MPRDPQGAETRTEWRNVHRDKNGSEWRSVTFKSRESCDAAAEELWPDYPRIAVERIETTTTITRHPIPPHAGEETKGCMT